MLQQLIDRYKNYRKQSFLNQPANYKHQYAFIGVGNHSIYNLYPALSQMAVPLKYIATRRPENAEKMAQRYAGATGTTDLSHLCNDPDVKGVMICTGPRAHFKLAKQMLEAGKTVFVEKPPCFTSAELDLLAKHGSKCFVGVQKRYAPSYQSLKSEVKTAQHYTLTYRVGAYPEGDALFDLYIHAIDLAVFLFGEASIESLQVAGGGDTLLLHLKHSGGSIGSLELSTAYSWEGAEENLEIITDKAQITVDGTREVLSTKRVSKLAGIPLEKVRKFTPEQRILWRQSSFLPVAEHNQLIAAGYFGELDNFIQFCETGKASLNQSTPASLKATYRLLEQIGKALS